MLCPECGANLGEASVTGFDKSFRCASCGGVWMEGWVLNSLAEEKEIKISPTSLVKQASLEASKAQKCPADSQPLFGYSGEDIPPEISAYKCSHCGWWWFGGNSLFDFKKAYEAKVNYLKFWKRKSQAVLMALPILMVLVLVVGLGIGVANITKTQGTQVSAGLESEFRAEKEAGGMVLRFKLSKPVEMIMVRQLDREEWRPARVMTDGANGYKVVLQGLGSRQVYQVQIEGKRYYFQTK